LFLCHYCISHSHHSSGQGGATLNKPPNWTSQDLSSLFKKVAQLPARQPTRSFGPEGASGLTRAQRIGIIIGSAAVVVLLLALVGLGAICCLIKRRKRKSRRPRSERVELPASHTPDVCAVPLVFGIWPDVSEQKSTTTGNSLSGEPGTPVGEEVSQPDTPRQTPHAPVVGHQEYPSPLPIHSFTPSLNHSALLDEQLRTTWLHNQSQTQRRPSTRNYIAYLYRSGYSTEEVRHALMQNYQLVQPNQPQLGTSGTASPTAEKNGDGPSKEEASEFGGGFGRIASSHNGSMYPSPLIVSKRSTSSPMG
jgi:hypothetical protein